MKSPGHRNWPDHRVRESRLAGKARVEVERELVADSDDVVVVEEDGHPARLYFPRTAVLMDKLEPSSTTTQCPFKGTARHFNIRVDGRKLADAAWSYEEPFDEHQALKGRLAFYDDKFGDIHVQTWR
jgi:uncharacterized protein (DUF427 family)